MGKTMTFSRRTLVGAAAAAPMVTVGGIASLKALSGDTSYKFVEQVLQESYGSICSQNIMQKFYKVLKKDGTLIGPLDKVVEDADQHWTLKRVIVEEFSLRTNILDITSGSASNLEIISA